MYRKIELMDRKITELKQITNEVGWVFTILSSGLMPGQMEPVSVWCVSCSSCFAWSIMFCKLV